MTQDRIPLDAGSSRPAMGPEELDTAMQAGYAHVHSVIEQADGFNGHAPFWHGWALREAFVAGATWAGQTALPSAPAVEGVERELVERLSKHGCKWTVGDDESEQRARDCDLAASAISRLVKERDEATRRFAEAAGAPSEREGEAIMAEAAAIERAEAAEASVARLTALLAEADEDAARDVLAERSRQKTAEGWTTEHDDEHNAGELANAAACYAMTDPPFFYEKPANWVSEVIERLWPWWNVYDNDDRIHSRTRAWWKPSDRRRDLVKAGALILAEIERLDRAAIGNGGGDA